MTRTAYIVIGLGYGDEGKGSWTDHLVRKTGARYVVRFNGGAQAAHHVVTGDGRQHCFSQLGSGMFVPGVHTLLSRFMLVEPSSLLTEASVLESKGVERPLEHVLISGSAPVITPFNRLLNQIQEVARCGAKHGSCGLGIGLTQKDVETLGEEALYMRDVQRSHLREKLDHLWRLKLNESRQYATADNAELREKLKTVDIDHYVGMFRRLVQSCRVVSEGEFRAILADNDMVFEGAQGVMLDQRFGTFPHCTRSNCTSENALLLLSEAQFSGTVERVGLLRAYATRHGDGPFVTEAPFLSVDPCHNSTNQWQGRFRLGWFDAPAARYALRVGGVDTLAITNLDRLVHLPKVKVATRYHGGDERFFDASGEFRLPPDSELSWLAARTEAMKAISPAFAHLQLSSDSGGYQRFCEALADQLGHPIAACSTTASDRKLYLGT